MTIPDPNQSQPFNQPQTQAPEPKKKKKWPWIVGIGAVLVVFAAAGGGDSEDSGTSAGDNDVAVGTSPTEEAPVEMSPAEVIAPVEEQPATLKVGEAGETGGMSVTVDNARFASDMLGNYLCTDVSLTNNGDSQKRFNQFDFKLEKPNGVVADTTFTGLDIKNLETAELNPGGTTDGTVCFDSDGTPGKYTIVYEGGFFDEPLTWAANL